MKQHMVSFAPRTWILEEEYLSGKAICFQLGAVFNVLFLGSALRPKGSRQLKPPGAEPKCRSDGRRMGSSREV